LQEIRRDALNMSGGSGKTGLTPSVPPAPCTGKEGT
jgi:hypothetical protein